ncbi:MAG: hybrid sensor histidine kinase/response regulator [Stygiobacter sp.]|nr:MAG: hybrid sensor histidine kinase/response regulator [Stygiobacter sp.]
MNRIFIIEDDEKLRINICRLLKSEGYEADFAENGKIGIEKIRKIFPHLIICDIMMPGMSGSEVLEELMKDPETATIPFIFLTAKVEQADLRKGMKAGADDYLFKPFNIEDLLEAIKTRLKKKNINDQKIEEIKEHILAKIQHELRTPLVSILGFSQLIEENENIEQIKDMVRKINYSGKTLHKKIEKFLLYNYLVLIGRNNYKNTHLTIQHLYTEETIFYCLSKLNQELIPKERVKINFEPVTLPLQDEMFETIILELIENGLKYSVKHQSVMLSGYRMNGHYKICVTDTGKGMSSRDISSISAFNKFCEDKISESGLGLGLAIVQKIVDLVGGKIEIKSELNKFTSCEVTIPLN